MKQNISLASSTSILIGAVIAILALLRGPVQTVLLLLTFALWGLWVVVTLLRPSWRANRDYRRREERAEKKQNDFSGKNLAGLLLCHVNYRVSDYLKRAYPDARWEWMMPDPVLFIVQGGTGRIRVYGVPDYEYADVTLDKNGKLDCSMVKIVPVQGSGQGAPTGHSPADPSVWYELEGRGVLETLIADLRSRGHSSLTLNEDGSISFQPEAGSLKATKRAFASFPEPVYWPRLADVLNQEGLTTDVQADHIAVSW